MTATVPRAVFVNADPMAVFAVLADLKTRAKVIGSVAGTVLETPSPVRQGTLFRETRKGLFSRSRLIRIETFVPPLTLGFSRRRFGLRAHITLQLADKAGGTNILIQSSGNAALLPDLLAGFLADRWAGEMERDLQDIRRFVEARANPHWRPGIANSSPSSPTK